MHYVLAIVLLLTGPAAAAPPDPTVATSTYKGEPTGLVFGDLTVRLMEGPATRDETASEVVAEIATPGGKLRLSITDDGGARAQARIVRLAPGPEPQVLFQHGSVGSAACVKSKLGTFIDGTWHALDLDRICEAEGGYDVVDAPGDGSGVLVSPVVYFMPFADHVHEGSGPIRIQRLVGSRLVTVTGSPRYRELLRKNLPAAPEVGSGRADAAIWMATQALLGERAQGWAKLRRVFGRDRKVFDVCAVRETPSEECPASQRRKAPFLQALDLVLVANGYVASADDLPLP